MRRRQHASVTKCPRTSSGSVWSASAGCIWPIPPPGNGALVGRTLRVLYEDIDYERNMFRGRTEQNAPDIDTSVFFTADFVEAGQVYDVRITAADGYDLIGEVI